MGKRNSKGQFTSKGGGGRRSNPGSPTPTPKRDHITIEHRDGTRVHVPLSGRREK